MQREESKCSARSSTEEWRTSEALQTIQRTFWVASHCCCGIGQSCMPMSCWKLQVAKTVQTGRLRGLQSGILERAFERSLVNSRIRKPVSLMKRRSHEHWRNRTWTNWRGDYQKSKRRRLSSENGKLTRP